MTVFRQLVILASTATLCLAQSTITVYVGTKYQQIDGFGFSQAFGRASEFQNVNASTQKQALDYLFSTSTGAGFSIIRNRIGSGGAGDSIEPNNPGSPSATPNYMWDNNDSGQLWFTKQAASYGVKTIYADAWGAPGFMKTSGSDSSPGWVNIPSTVSHTAPKWTLINCETDIFAVARDILVLLATGGKRTQTFLCNMSNTTRRQATLSHTWDS